MGLLSKEQLRQFIKENDFKTAKDIGDSLKDMFKEVLQEALEAEMEEELGYSKYDYKTQAKTNYRNGYSKKKVKSDAGLIELEIPRDRNSEFEPQIVPKHSRDISSIEDKILAMYAKGMSTRDINSYVKDIYGIDISAEMVSKITDKIIPVVKEWQNRPLEDLYTFVFMDAIHYKVKDNGQIVNKAAYIVLGINRDGIKDVLGIWIGENETSKFWLSVLNDLKNRGVKDVLIFSTDGLPGFKEAIKGTFPNSEVQRCIIHQIRNTIKYVSYKDVKAFVNDLKLIYTAPNEQVGYENLQEVKKKWGSKYPYSLKSWGENWDVLSPFFKYPEEIRRIMYTTNAIENLNRQYRKVTKGKAVFSTDDALLKSLYLATMDITKKWTMRHRDWNLIINQLTILFENRV